MNTPQALVGLTPQQLAALDLSLDEIGISQRHVNALDEKGISKVRDLLQMRESELRGMKNFGERTIVFIYECLAAQGFKRGRSCIIPEQSSEQRRPQFEDDLPPPPKPKPKKKSKKKKRKSRK